MLEGQDLLRSFLSCQSMVTSIIACSRRLRQALCIIIIRVAMQSRMRLSLSYRPAPLNTCQDFTCAEIYTPYKAYNQPSAAGLEAFFTPASSCLCDGAFVPKDPPLLAAPFCPLCSLFRLLENAVLYIKVTMKLLNIVTAGSLLLSVHCVAVPNPASNLLVHEKRHVPPTRWIKRDRTPPNAILPVRIGLTQNNLEKGHDFLMNV